VLAWYAEGFEQRSGINVHLEMPSDFERQPSDLETAAFRIVQECLTNTHRHSKSSTAVIRIYQFADGLTLEVKDTGRGIPSETLSKISSVGLPGVGLRGMRERVTALGGAFEIFSEGQGTAVKAAIPLHTAKRSIGPMNAASRLGRESTPLVSVLVIPDSVG
jgi:two-component system, NarL family, sensor kinase